MNQIHAHVQNDTARQPAGVRGWLLLLSLWLLLWGPVNAALITAAVLPAIAVRGWPLAIGLLALVAVTAVGVAAGMALIWKRGPAVLMAKTALILGAAIDLVRYTGSYFPSNRMPGDTPFYLAGSLACYGLWFAYLVRSKRLKNTY